MRTFANTSLAEWAMIGRKFTPSERREFRRILNHIPSKTLSSRCRAALSALAPNRLPCPALCVTASRDQLVAQKASDQLAALCSKIVEIDAPHFVIQASPAEAANAVGAFIDDTS